MTNANGVSGNAAARFMYVFGAFILVAVVGWYAFSAVDRMGLPTQGGQAVVAAKAYKPPGMTSTKTIINNRSVNIPQATAEAFVLTLSLQERQAAGLVDRELYEDVKVGESVQVTYQRRRITGGLQVVKVTR